MSLFRGFKINVSANGFGLFFRSNFSSVSRTLFQYSIRRLIVRSRKVSKPRDLYLELSDRSEIWQAPRQHCCRCACQISWQCDNLNYQSRGFETSWDFTVRRLMGYWNGAQGPCTKRWRAMHIRRCSDHPLVKGKAFTDLDNLHIIDQVVCATDNTFTMDLLQDAF